MGYEIIAQVLLRYGGWIAAVLAAGWIYHQGGAAERQRQELVSARANVELLQKQRAAADQVLEHARADAVLRDAHAQELEGKVQQYEADLARETATAEDLQRRHDETVAQFEERLRLARTAKPQAAPAPRSCTLSDADVRGLLSIK